MMSRGSQGRASNVVSMRAGGGAVKRKHGCLTASTWAGAVWTGDGGARNGQDTWVEVELWYATAHGSMPTARGWQCTTSPCRLLNLLGLALPRFCLARASGPGPLGAVGLTLDLTLCLTMLPALQTLNIHVPTSRYTTAQEYLDRLALSLGGKAVSDAAAPLLGSWLQDAQWQKRAAVFICLAQIAEGCQKVGREEETILTRSHSKGAGFAGCALGVWITWLRHSAEGC